MTLARTKENDEVANDLSTRSISKIVDWFTFVSTPIYIPDILCRVGDAFFRRCFRAYSSPREALTAVDGVARGMAIKPAGLQLSDALVRKARHRDENGIASLGRGGARGCNWKSHERLSQVSFGLNCAELRSGQLEFSLSLSFSVSVEEKEVKCRCKRLARWPTSFSLRRSIRFADIDRGSSNFFILASERVEKEKRFPCYF